MSNRTKTFTEQAAEITRLKAENQRLQTHNAALMRHVEAERTYSQSLLTLVQGHAALLKFAGAINAAMLQLAVDSAVPDPTLQPTTPPAPPIEGSEFDALPRGD